jgi:hypothetical protein
MEKVIKPDIEGEMDEFQRISQDLRRDEKIDISVKELVRSFDGLKEQTLTDDVWPKLENTESNEIEKGDIEAVNDIAKMYNKTNPKKLIKAIKSGEYERPLILKMGDRYILIAGNTRLCTAAAMGVNPKVFIGEIGEDVNEIEEAKREINEKCWKGYTQKGMKTMFGKRYPNCVKKETNEASSPAQQAAIAINMKKKGIEPKEEVTGNKEIDKNLDSNQQDMVYGIVDIIKKIKNKDNRLSVANDMIKKFKEEDIKFDYNEFLNMCGCSKKTETKESMGAGGSGSFEGPVFSDVVLKKDIHKFHNSNLKEQQEEVGEATDASSSGGYDVPLFGKTPKGRRNPLKIDGPDSIYKGRAVTDKKFPKWGGPGGVFVKIKEKCKKFPYCNQGDTGALEFIKEDKEIVQAITETSKKYGIPYKEMEKIVLNEINKIFI